MNWNDFKEWDLKDQSYRFNKWLIRIWGIVFLLMGIWVVIISQGKTYSYSFCPSHMVDGKELGATCFNKFFNSNLCSDGTLDKSSRICSQQLLSPGESIGELPPWIVSNYLLLIFIGVMLLLFVNHFLYNKNFKFDFRNGD